MVSAFAHAQPGWWYLPWLPVLFAPWLLLPWLWKYLWRSMRHPGDTGLRLCLVWLLSTLLLMSITSGKQLKYLLPVLPAFALLVSRVLSLAEQQGATRRPRALAVLLLLGGMFLVAAPSLFAAPPWAGSVSPLWGGALIAGAVALALMKPLRMEQYPVMVAVLSAGVLSIVYLGVFRIAAPAYDLREASRVIAAAQAAGRPVASSVRVSRPVRFLRPAGAPHREPAPGAGAGMVQGTPGGLCHRLLSRPGGRTLRRRLRPTLSRRPSGDLGGSRACGRSDAFTVECRTGPPFPLPACPQPRFRS